MKYCYFINIFYFFYFKEQTSQTKKKKKDANYELINEVCF